MEIRMLFPISNKINNNPDDVKVNINMVVFMESLGVNPHFIHCKFFYIWHFRYSQEMIRKIINIAILKN